MYGDDVRMVEHGHCGGFALEPFGESWILPDSRGEDFERDEPIEPFLPGAIDHAHAAAADEVQDLQIGEKGAPVRRAWAA